MTYRLLRIALPALIVAQFAAPLTSPLAAQVRPTAQDAQTLLQTRPDLVAQLQQRIGASGLTPEQVRARLKAEGYPETLLDGYLKGGNATTRDSLPGDEVLNAVRALGITDSTDVEGLREAINKYQRAQRSMTGSAGIRSYDPVTGLPIAANRRADSLKTPLSERIFGLDVFRSVTSEFLPNVDGPVDAGYKIGPGDRLVLILTGDVELAHTLDVTREGSIVIPQVGQLSVANLTLGQLESLLYTRLGKVYSGVKRGADATTRFSISVAKLRSNQVFVVGEAERPGSFRISSAGTALSALYAAGGPTDRGSLRAISIRRGGKTIATLDVYNYLLRGDASNDIRLENGDVVFIPVHGPRVRIAGEVTRAATYELKDSETLADLLNAAGGFAADAGRQRLQIERITPPSKRTGAGRDRVLLDVGSDELASGNVPALKLEAGDVVRVFPVDRRVRNSIDVKGHVWLAGSQGRSDELTLSQALKRAGGAKPDAYLGEVLLTRLEADSTRTQLRASLRDTTGAVLGTDIVLRDDDEIRVFSKTEFRPNRYVAISGAVRKPGQYPYREGITMRDLVLLAGGVEERAFLNEAEVARLPDDRSGGVTAKTIRAPLDSTYLFERGLDGKYAGPPGLSAPSASAPEFTLKAYDNVLILAQPDWRLLRTVFVSGEVKFPGRYTISNKSERINDLIARAGGLTREANTDGAYFARRSAATSYRGGIDSVRSRSDTATRVGIEVGVALKHPEGTDNLILEHGDSLDIPTQRQTVEIRGAVNAPTVVALEGGQKLEHYIRAAGGASRVALSGSAYVVQPNGKIESRHRILWLFRADPTPRAGASIIVPVKDTTEVKGSTLQTFSIVAQLVATILTAIAVAKK
jgi:polysaccharide export outer membrane protein